MSAAEPAAKRAALSVPASGILSQRSLLDAGDASALLAHATSNPCGREISGTDDSRAVRLADVGELLGLVFCPLCNGALRKPAFIATCTTKHFFCAECIWARHREGSHESKCPSCTTHFSASHIIEDVVLGSIVETLVGRAVEVFVPGAVRAAHEVEREVKRKVGVAGGGGDRKPRAVGVGVLPAPAHGGKLMERFGYRIALPLPDGFPHLPLRPDSDMLYLYVHDTQSVGRHRTSALMDIACKRAVAAGAPFNPAQWNISLSVEGHVLADDAVPLAEAARAVHAKLGNTHVTESPPGYTGQYRDNKDLRRAPLCEIVITVAAVHA